MMIKLLVELHLSDFIIVISDKSFLMKNFSGLSYPHDIVTQISDKGINSGSIIQSPFN